MNSSLSDNTEIHFHLKPWVQIPSDHHSEAVANVRVDGMNPSTWVKGNVTAVAAAIYRMQETRLGSHDSARRMVAGISQFRVSAPDENADELIQFLGKPFTKPFATQAEFDSAKAAALGTFKSEGANWIVIERKSVSLLDIPEFACTTTHLVAILNKVKTENHKGQVVNALNGLLNPVPKFDAEDFKKIVELAERLSVGIRRKYATVQDPLGKFLEDIKADGFGLIKGNPLRGVKRKDCVDGQYSALFDSHTARRAKLEGELANWVDPSIPKIEEAPREYQPTSLAQIDFDNSRFFIHPNYPCVAVVRDNQVVHILLLKANVYTPDHDDRTQMNVDSIRLPVAEFATKYAETIALHIRDVAKAYPDLTPNDYVLCLTPESRAKNEVGQDDRRMERFLLFMKTTFISDQQKEALLVTINDLYAKKIGETLTFETLQTSTGRIFEVLRAELGPEVCLFQNFAREVSDRMEDKAPMRFFLANEVLDRRAYQLAEHEMFAEHGKYAPVFTGQTVKGMPARSSAESEHDGFYSSTRSDTRPSGDKVAATRAAVRSESPRLRVAARAEG